MRRELGRLEEGVFDLCVVGGGIHGAFVAREAALRGLSVALVEKDDFGSATSSNSLRIVHGGFRCLQTGDVVRLRESVRERRAWLRIAPHLVEPLPVLIPGYRGGIKSKTALAAAAGVYELLAGGRNAGVDPSRRIPRGRIASRREVLETCPFLEPRGLTGGIVVHDARMRNSERLLLAVVRAAVERGACVANYVEATGPLHEAGRLAGVVARDALGGSELRIRARLVVNAAGPWVERVLGRLGEDAPRKLPPLTKAWNLGLAFAPPPLAVGLHAGGDSSVLFLHPWHGLSLVGTAHRPTARPEPDACVLEPAELDEFLAEIRRSAPGLTPTPDQVRFAQVGLVPGHVGREGHVTLPSRTRIVERRDGSLSLVSVKYTTARRVAEQAVERALWRLGRSAPSARSSETPLFGGDVASLDALLAEASARPPEGLDAAAAQRLVGLHGSAFRGVLKHADGDPGACVPGTPVLAAEVVHAVREEMAQRLADVVFRRTELGALGLPEEAALRGTAERVAHELGWSPDRTEKEIEAVRAAVAWRPARV